MDNYRSLEFIDLDFIKKIYNKNFFNKNFNKTRDLFLLSFYLGGIDIRELLIIKPNKLIKGAAIIGSNYGIEFPFPLIDEAEKIFNRYEGTYYALDVLKNVYDDYKKKELFQEASRYRIHLDYDLDFMFTSMKLPFKIRFQDINIIWNKVARELDVNKKIINYINEIYNNPYQRKLTEGLLTDIYKELNLIMDHFFGIYKRERESEYPKILDDGSILYYED